MSVTIIQGNLLNAKEEYIAHQCNCVSTDAKALAKDIFEKFPSANTYHLTRIPGTISFHDRIINMYAQYYPTFAKYNNDNSSKRQAWFIQCLDEIAKYDINNIAMPYNIGCGGQVVLGQFIIK